MVGAAEKGDGQQEFFLLRLHTPPAQAAVIAQEVRESGESAELRDLVQSLLQHPKLADVLGGSKILTRQLVHFRICREHGDSIVEIGFGCH